MHITDQDLENLYEPLSVEINQISYSGDIIQYKPTAYQSSDDAFSNLQVGLMEVELKQDELYEQVDNMEIGQYLVNWHIMDEPVIIEDYFRNLFKETPIQTTSSNMWGGSMFRISKNTVKNLVKFKCSERTIEFLTSNPELDNFLTAGNLYYDSICNIAISIFVDPKKF